jgi:tryptophan synthase alpha chain
MLESFLFLIEVSCFALRLLVMLESFLFLILMGYLNPVLQYGIEEFCRSCSEVGIDGVILPDLPLDIFVENYQELFASYGLSFIFLITPETTGARIREIDKASTAFIYAVSSSSTTGSKSSIDDAQEYLRRLDKMQLKHPILTGFNIKDRDSYEAACQHTRGGIIGSAFIRSLSQSGDLKNTISTFIKSIRTS